ncbi:MAG: non-canonical purine NTP pyrophosphatase [Anaerolineae bacterium]
MKQRCINFVTSNAAKATMLGQLLEPFGFEVLQLDTSLIEPQANTVEAVAINKAEQALKLAQTAVVVEDSGFYIDELSGFPSAYTRYALETIGVGGLLRLAQGLTTRSCRFVSTMVYMTPDGTAQVFNDARGAGVLAQSVDETPCPEAWSDLWRIVIPDGQDKPLTALTADERKQVIKQWQAQSVYGQFANWLSTQ